MKQRIKIPIKLHWWPPIKLHWWPQSFPIKGPPPPLFSPWESSSSRIEQLDLVSPSQTPQTNIQSSYQKLSAHDRTMTLAVYTLILQAAQRIATIDKFPSLMCALRPIHLLLTIVLSTAMVTFYLLHRPRTVYLVDYACYTTREIRRSPKASFLEHMRISTSFSDSTINFIERVLELSGMGEETWVTSAFAYIEPYCVRVVSVYESVYVL
jgi:hypothetical protein